MFNIVSRKLLLALTLLTAPFVYASEISYEDNESEVRTSDDADKTRDDYFDNDVGVLIEEEEIKQLKQSYISPYNYLQDPIALNMGSSAKAESTGTFHLGTSFIAGMNSPMNGQNTAINTNVVQVWGQTERFGGFALGGAGTAVVNFRQIGQPNTFSTTSVFSPSQAYVDYQYSNKLDVVAGNILISTPWVTSFGSNPGGTYAMGNNSYQAALVNIQALPSLLITGFSAWNYTQYPNNWGNQQTYYNNGGVLASIGSTPTNGPSGLGLTWNPVDSYSGQLWLYNFADYAKMIYADNSYHVDVASKVSFDFGLQGFMQSSSGSEITNQFPLPGQTTPAGVIASNGVGGRIALNVANNTTSISYNNIFGSSGSFLNGGMVTPYTYGMEVDPLYTTPALTSLAELGSGYAYTLRNSTSFMDNSLKFNLSMSQFFVNQVYVGQATAVTEYDASLLYRIPHTNMNVWTRLVYLEQAEDVGGNMLQPRIIFNWTY